MTTPILKHLFLKWRSQNYFMNNADEERKKYAMDTPPTINCSADTNEVHPMLSLFSVSCNSENLFERRVTLIQNGRNWDLQILGRVRVGFSTQKHLLFWKVRSLSLAGAKTVYDTKKVLWTSRFYFFPAKKGLHCLLINAPSFLLKKTKMMLPRVLFFPIKCCDNFTNGV